ncbi:MAG: hypothetical protein ACNI3C_02405 [Candidatus Marinarcus sp.]|uniref:hypothetical protein n=1 Tax=Candidatus Marinarcus sp. TaxID=3100987 RepID=UPI003B0065B6
MVDGKSVGYISKLHPSVASDYDLRDSFIAEIDFDAIKNDLIKGPLHTLNFKHLKKI